MNSVLQEALLATKNVNHAAIIRLKDQSIKARSSHALEVSCSLVLNRPSIARILLPFGELK
jgi:hypothetical protein